MDIWEYIKVGNFLRDYAPEVKGGYRKTRGKNGRGNPVEFTAEDIRHIKEGIKKMCNDILKA